MPKSKDPKPQMTHRKYECGHCSTNTAMSIWGENHKLTREEYEQGSISLIFLWLTLECPACGEINVYQESYFDEYPDTPGSKPSVDRLFPQGKRVFKNLPQFVQTSLQVARRLKSNEPLASAVFVGRTVEYVCNDRNAQGKNLEEKIKDLSSKGEIPNHLAQMAQNSRLFRNLGAHATGVDKISRSDAEILYDFCEAILEYIYEAPVMLKEIERRLSELKQEESNWKSSRKKITAPDNKSGDKSL